MTTSWLYDADDILQETVTGGANPGVFRYIHGPGIDEPLARIENPGPSEVLTYYHADGLGSIVATTSQAGAIVSTRRYDAWGNLEVGADQPGYAFTGRELDPETGLYYYRARYYDPKLGRFISEDPIGFAGGVNFFSYVANAPTGLRDPSGRIPVDTIVDVGMLIWDLAHGNWEDAALDLVAMALPYVPAPVVKARHILKADDGAKACSIVQRGARNPKVAAAARRGQLEHKNRQYGRGFKKESQLPSGKRMDAYNAETKEVIELKPNNPRAVRRGEAQVKEYCAECDTVYGPGHLGKVEIYE